MMYFKKYKHTITQKTNKLVYFNNYSVSYFFSRFGNNLQQIANGIIYCNFTKSNFYSPKHQYIDKFKVINNKLHALFFTFKKYYRFFYFLNSEDFPTKLSNDFLIKNIQSVFKESISPNINFLNDMKVDEKMLVIHIRSGDIFKKHKKDYYQNPLSYYERLINLYEKVLIVTSSDRLNPVCKILGTYKNVEIQSSSFENDFNTLYNATNLATSGVGTFPIAAALMSKKLKNIYYTNLYLGEHLNPEMITDNDVKHHKFKISESYKKDYETSKNLNELILDKNYETTKF